ncbi:MAG: oxidoreductase [Treponema sp.]|nr:oxidoreductase [Treponema sp.]
MSKLSITLPPLAPDYSGAASSLFDLGGMIVIHDASGCTGNYVGYEEPRWFNAKTPVFCSGLRHMDAILGTDDVFVERILAAADSLKPRFIAILGSPVPMIIGTDFKGLAKDIESRTGIPCFGVATNGLHYYGTGFNQAIIPLVKRLAMKVEDKMQSDSSVVQGKHEKNNAAHRGVNILGVTPIDFSLEHNDEDFKNLFASNGIPVIANFCMGLSLDDVAHSSSAQLNVVVSQSGVETALFMYREYGIPFTVQTPVADAHALLFHVQRFLCGKIAHEQNGFVPFPIKESADTGKKILIAGDQVISLSIRNYFREKGCNADVRVASLFDTTPFLLESSDYAIKHEKQLRTILRDEHFAAVIADPLVLQLVKTQGTKCVPVYHSGVSGRISWNMCPRFMSREFENVLNKVIGWA